MVQRWGATSNGLVMMIYDVFFSIHLHLCIYTFAFSHFLCILAYFSSIFFFGIAYLHCLLIHIAQIASTTSIAFFGQTVHTRASGPTSPASAGFAIHKTE